MHHIIIGTAGHVDHGKTALIKAITGIDTDRLKEEKRRGITIELGFASLDLESGQKVGIIDVPGHEKFVKNMVAGAGGIDLVCMVIAADEGVMPQTKEHMEICELLNIEKGIIALTKCDMVDDEWLSLIEDDIRNAIKETFLENAPIVPVSSVTGAGIPQFITELSALVSGTKGRADSGFFRLPVDRVFTMKGFGTVITGTLISGTMKTGETVELMPSRTRFKVRGIEVHNAASPVAEAGQRTAVNLQGVEKSMIDRGETLVHPGIFEPSFRADIVFNYLPSAARSFKNRALARFHTGTSETMARMILLEGASIEPGEKIYGQLYLKSPSAMMAGDRFILRSYSPVTTIGGGRILDPLAKKHKSNEENLIEDMETLENGTPPEKTKIILERTGTKGITAVMLAVRTGTSLKKQEKIVEEMLSKKEALLVDKDERTIVSRKAYSLFQARIVNEVTAYHVRQPLMEGISKEELKNTVSRFIGVKLFTKALRDLEDEGTVTVKNDCVSMREHSVRLSGDLESLKVKVESLYLGKGLTVPTLKETYGMFPNSKAEIEDILGILLKEGSLIKVAKDLYFHREAIEKLRNDYRTLLKNEEKGTPAGFKELTGLSRKYIIPLMEYFDSTKLTIRVGDHRVLRERGQ